MWDPKLSLIRTRVIFRNSSNWTDLFSFWKKNIECQPDWAIKSEGYDYSRESSGGVEMGDKKHEIYGAFWWSFLWLILQSHWGEGVPITPTPETAKNST